MGYMSVLQEQKLTIDPWRSAGALSSQLPPVG
jgi:hypothetical protein